jgi:hypothetical protein
VDPLTAITRPEVPWATRWRHCPQHDGEPGWVPSKLVSVSLVVLIVRPSAGLTAGLVLAATWRISRCADPGQDIPGSVSTVSCGSMTRRRAAWAANTGQSRARAQVATCAATTSGSRPRPPISSPA